MNGASRSGRRESPRAWRFVLLALGWLLIAAAPVLGVLPGPGGIFLAAAGIALLLKNSVWAKRVYVRAKRRWPAWGGRLDRFMRRASALRRHALAELNIDSPKRKRRPG